MRLIGDPAENSLLAATEMVIQSNGDDSANCGLKANALEFAGSENLRLYGHTSWEMSRYNRSEIALEMGRRTRVRPADVQRDRLTPAPRPCKSAALRHDIVKSSYVYVHLRRAPSP